MLATTFASDENIQMFECEDYLTNVDFAVDSAIKQVTKQQMVRNQSLISKQKLKSLYRIRM